MPYVLAVDEGTTGVTVLVLDEGRRVRGRAYREVPCTYPRPGWVEQDAEAVWGATRATMRAALRAAKARPGDVAGVGIANQRETTVVWSRRTGRPVGPAIVWQDRRTAARCRELAGTWTDAVRSKTGLVIDPYFSATKLEWILGSRGIRDRARRGELAFGTVDSFLAWRMTGRHVTEPTNASRTLLWDIRRGQWDPELLGLFGVPEALLPDVVPSSQVVAPLLDGVLGGGARATGPSLAAMAGDQQAALFGQGCVVAGDAKNTYGTGCFLLQHTGGQAKASVQGLLTTRAASTDRRPQFALEGSVFVAGAAIQWLRDGLGLVREAREVDELAQKVPDSAGVHLVPAFTGLGAPYWDPEARGALVGLTRGADRRHLARATLESIAFQSAELVGAMEKDSGHRIPALRVDGGATRSRPLMQFQADLLQRPVVRPANIETTAMGAGLLAGLAVDAWGLRDVRGGAERETAFRPRMKAREAERRLAVWRQAVAAARAFKPG